MEAEQAIVFYKLFADIGDELGNMIECFKHNAQHSSEEADVIRKATAIYDQYIQWIESE
tara:strand:- start:29612 stop:29788 length:177 start_codon:yes stop_codon:yes gene_type:complete